MNDLENCLLLFSDLCGPSTLLRTCFASLGGDIPSFGCAISASCFLTGLSTRSVLRYVRSCWGVCRGASEEQGIETNLSELCDWVFDGSHPACGLFALAGENFLRLQNRWSLGEAGLVPWGVRLTFGAGLNSSNVSLSTHTRQQNIHHLESLESQAFNISSAGYLTTRHSPFHRSIVFRYVLSINWVVRENLSFFWMSIDIVSVFLSIHTMLGLYLWKLGRESCRLFPHKNFIKRR